MIVDAQHQTQFGVPVVNDRFPEAFRTVASADEVVAGRSALQAGGVDGYPFHPLLATQVETHGGRKKFPRGRPFNKRQEAL